MAENKNTKKSRVTIEGSPADILALKQRFRGSSLSFKDEQIDQEEISKVSVPETQENTTARMQKVMESNANVQMAPNLVDHDAQPNDELDKRMRAAEAEGIATENELHRREVAYKENERQVKEKLSPREQALAPTFVKPNMDADERSEYEKALARKAPESPRRVENEKHKAEERKAEERKESKAEQKSGQDPKKGRK